MITTEKQAAAMQAMSKLGQIMSDDERFGGFVTDEEWCTYSTKFVIVRTLNKLEVVTHSGSAYFFFAFHTKEQAHLFLDENEDLIRQYYMLNNE